MFETPVIVGTMAGAEALIADLSLAVRARMAADKGLKRSNEGGWHSDTLMMGAGGSGWGGKAANLLAEGALGMAQRMTAFDSGRSAKDFEWRIAMWANVSPAGGLNHAHSHPGNIWAAVFYLDAGDDEAGGSIYFEDPRYPMIAMRAPGLRMAGADGKGLHTQVDITPKTGELILFPAWLRHGVRTYTGGRERISVAVNIDAREK